MMEHAHDPQIPVCNITLTVPSDLPKQRKGPYLARLDPGFTREFAEHDGPRMTVEAAVGDLVEGRGPRWSEERGEHTMAYFVAVLTEGGLITISRELAEAVDAYRGQGCHPLGVYQIEGPTRVRRLDTDEVFDGIDTGEASVSAGLLVVDPQGGYRALPETGETGMAGVRPLSVTDANGDLQLKGFESIAENHRRDSMPFLNVEAVEG